MAVGYEAGAGRYDLDALETLVAQDPGSPEFPALAEALRRSGDAERARSVAERGLEAQPTRLAGRVALGLALLDLGLREEARGALAPVLDAVLEPHRRATAALEVDAELDADAVDDGEIDAAFAAAEPQIDEMISPNRMAEQVLLDHAPIEGDDSLLADDDDALGEPGAVFHTLTMADLLARQGDSARAEAIRRELSAPRPGSVPEGRGVDAAEVPEWMADASDSIDAPELEVFGVESAGDPRRAHILGTLERWLQNIQRGVA